MQNKLKGKQGEKIAEEYLKNKGWQILDRNFHYSKFAEIDLVARVDNEIVFVEVKTRTTSNFGAPEEAVDYRKMHNIFVASQYYLKEKNIKNLKPRIDVVAIILNEKEFKIRHKKTPIPFLLRYESSYSFTLICFPFR
jgi:putative endonuclease